MTRLHYRYLGVEEDGSTSKESQSQALLAKLLQKAKEKQKQSLTEQRPDLVEEQMLKQVDKKKRRADKNSSQEPQPHKKRKSEVAPLCSSPLHHMSEPPVIGKDGQEDTEVAEAEHDLSKQTTDMSSAPTGFTVVGGFENKPVQKIHRVLPQWLAQPDVIHKDIKNNQVPISDISQLCAPLVKKLQNNGIQHFFPVQAEVIPAILESMQLRLLIGCGGYKPRDICVSAPTGSGKTLAFVIPVIQMLIERVVCEVRALAVLPTKELAQQVCKVFTSYAEGTTLKVVMLAGQRSFAAEQASLSEQRGGMRCSLADIVVTTPGRLVDHINKKSGLCLKHLRFLIIDEADRMIESMQQSWLSHVMRAVFKSGSEPRARSIFRRTEPAYITAASLSPPQMPLQKLLFSATLTQNPEKLQQLGLHQPRLFSSIHSNITTPAVPNHKQDRFDFPQGLTEHYVPCTLSSKPLLILHFLLRMKLSPILCFTNSRETAHRLFLLVQLFGGINAAEFSSRLSPGERKKKLKEFEQGKIQLLVCTDAAARGIDINRVKCVVNYDAPQYIRTYIHRIGRTARAGKTGLAFTLLLRVQEKNFLQMVVEAGSPGIQKQIVKPENLQGMKARYEQTLQELAMVIKDEGAK
ncbi:ATP-dependent RNA helicase DDX51 isoform X2 [Paralichthys olivaceus]|uniref:ATP-dependent RNA helicase DDX51 isoform X2 n=1 Tax=Paralichthys olivaceus TaxID=8255 RepID=UPI00097DA27B|nr:PREDICTED: ATP-dependent RNA helicase DDX51 isoform X2 [Paralichthys olivaceus]